jgi:GNAT superfamily N-acetyltransferase
MTEKILIRAAIESDAEPLGRLVVDTWRETYSGIFPSDFFKSFTYEQQIERAKAILGGPESGPRPVLAYIGGEHPVGFAFAGPNRNPAMIFDTELHTLYLLAKHHGQGIGKMLLEFVVSGEIERGSSSIFTWVVAANPTRDFYAKQGGVELNATQQRAFGSRKIEEVAFGWNDIAALRRRLGGIG